ncbi:hypothetical protein [Microbacterium maritypicum]
MSPEDYADLVERHARAFLALIRADAELHVFEGDADSSLDRFTNVFHTPGFFEGHTLNDDPVDVTVTFTVHSVGLDRWQAQWGSGRVLARVMRVPLQVEGRRCWPLRHQQGPPISKDKEVNPPKFLAIDTFDLKSTPA